LGGSPRFTIGLSDHGTKEIYFYMGQSSSFVGCPLTGWVNTGNVATPSNPVDDSHLQGGSYSDTYAHALAQYGGYSVAYIAIDFDSGWTESQSQAAEFDNTQIDGTLYTYEP
jgi:hypothetical protein